MSDDQLFDVVVVGAGPTGLTVAVQAALIGARVRVVERRARVRVSAPALAVQPRTMEVLRGLGVADKLLPGGLCKVELHVHVGKTTVEGRIHDLPLPETEYPFIFFVPQAEVEQVLRERLSELGVEVEGETEFVGLEQDGGRVRCQVRLADGREHTIASRFLVGCDGRESSVRVALGIPFRGRRYRRPILIADAEHTRDLRADTAHAFFTAHGIAFLFPLPAGRWRVIAPHPAGDDQPDLPALIEEHTNGKVRLGKVAWVEAVAPHHRLAARFRQGRVFLAGDAAHTHSPAGAQGMNTGIQDGVNLGWKLALVAGGAPAALLDTYETERRPVAKQVVRMTGLAHALEVSDLPLLRLGRRFAAKPVASLVLPRPRLVSLVARAVSGLDLRYRNGAISRSTRCLPLARPGSRLRDTLLVGGPPERVHHLVDGSAFHLLTLGDAAWEAIQEATRGYESALKSQRLSRAQLVSLTPRGRYPALVLVRPDGHVAVSCDETEAGQVRDYLKRWLVQDLGAAGSGGGSLANEHSPSERRSGGSAR